MFHVGWASASAGVTSVSSSRVRPRNGPPLAVRTIASAHLRARTGRAPNARCRPGSARRLPARVRHSARVARGDEALLCWASARVTPFSSAHIVPGKPAKPSGRVQHDIGLGRARAGPPGHRRPGSAGQGRRSASTRRRRRRARARIAPGITSIAWRPIDPVAPRRATRVMGTVCPVILAVCGRYCSLRLWRRPSQRSQPRLGRGWRACRSSAPSSC